MLRERHPDRVPIKLNATGFEISKKKFLVPQEHTFGSFIHFVRKKHFGKTKADQAYFFFVMNKLVPNSMILSELLSAADDDGIVNVDVRTESTFG
jgi:hypothetical protein